MVRNSSTTVGSEVRSTTCTSAPESRLSALRRRPSWRWRSLVRGFSHLPPRLTRPRSQRSFMNTGRPRSLQVRRRLSATGPSSFRMSRRRIPGQPWFWAASWSPSRMAPSASWTWPASMRGVPRGRTAVGRPWVLATFREGCAASRTSRWGVLPGRRLPRGRSRASCLRSPRNAVRTARESRVRWKDSVRPLVR